MSNEDPFAEGVKSPALSWTTVAVGQVIKITVTEAPTKVHSRDFTTGQPAYWDEAKTQPKYSAVFKGTVNGEERSIWAQMPSALFRAISEAQKNAGVKIGVGGELLVKRLNDEPNKNPKLNASHQFAAKYDPPADTGFGDEPPF